MTPVSFPGHSIPVGRELAVGDRIKDNDPRLNYTRLLTVAELMPGRVIARDTGGRIFFLMRNRIHCDEKVRRSGFSLVSPDNAGIQPRAAGASDGMPCSAQSEEDDR